MTAPAPAARRRVGTCAVCRTDGTDLTICQVLETAAGAGATVWACATCITAHPGLCPCAVADDGTTEPPHPRA